jgi:hypothetical protein
MGIAKTTELLNFHTVGVFFLILGGVVIALFARHTGQRDFGAHKNPSLLNISYEITLKKRVRAFRL